MQLDLPTEIFSLRDGRTLEFARYGDTTGHPVLFFHGFIGSHHQAWLVRESAARHGLNLIGVHRPGVGRTSPWARATIAESVADLDQLTRALGLRHFSVIGVSGGAPYALACLARLPEKVQHGMIVSGLGPVGEPALLEKMSGTLRAAVGLSRRFPALVRWTLALGVRAYRRDPGAFLARISRRWVPSDRELIALPEVNAMFHGDLRAALVQGQGAEGLTRELQLFSRWGFRLDEIPATTQVGFWHGRADRLIPPLTADYVARRLSRATVKLCPGGHFMVVNEAGAVLAELRGMLE